jgi:Zn-dependent protease
MLKDGYLRIGSWRGAPLRVHWSMPVGAFLLGRAEFVPVFWAAFFLIVLWHELGHAVMVRRFRHRVVSLDVTGIGGLCRWAGSATPYERSLIAWGGVAAQGLLLVVAAGVRLLLGPPTSVLWAEIESAAIQWNLTLIVLNLLPVAPFDGKEAWAFFRLWLERRRGQRVLDQILRKPGTKETAPRPRDDSDARELADKLQRIAEEARRARRGE